MNTGKRPTVEELERILASTEDVPITILPNGEIRVGETTMENEPAMLERVAWAIIQGLHSHLPEDQRPQAWADLNSQQEARIKMAALNVMALFDATPATPPTYQPQGK